MNPTTPQLDAITRQQIIDAHTQNAHDMLLLMLAGFVAALWFALALRNLIDWLEPFAVALLAAVRATLRRARAARRAPRPQTLR